MSQPEPTPRRYKRRDSRGNITQYPRPVRPKAPPKRRYQLKTWHERPQPFEITALRTKLGMNKTEFARTLGVGCSKVSQWEAGDLPMKNALIPLFREMQRLHDHLLQRRANPNWKL